jgi:hypothetical protein
VPLNPDFRDLFAALNAAGARYLLVGGYAVAFHAQPRFTKDLDIWTEPEAANAARVHEGLRRFGAPLQDLTTADLERPGTIFQIGVPPNRIDIVTGIDGVDFDEAWSGHTQTTYGGEAVPIIGRRELIRNKRASARPQDPLPSNPAWGRSGLTIGIRRSIRPGCGRVTAEPRHRDGDPRS